MHLEAYDRAATAAIADDILTPEEDSSCTR